MVNTRPPTPDELAELARRYPELTSVLLDESDRRPPPPGCVTVAEMRDLLARPAPLETALSVIELATAAPMGRPWIGNRQASPDSPRTLLIGSAEDAEEAFGPGAGDFLRRARPSPVVICKLAGGGVAMAPASTLTVAGLRAGVVHLEHDPQRSPPLRCTIDGEPVPLEQGADGIWRPKGAESDG